MVAIRRAWDIQVHWHGWPFQFGFHLDHTDPSLTLHLPCVIAAFGRLKQPGFRDMESCDLEDVNDVRLGVDMSELDKANRKKLRRMFEVGRYFGARPDADSHVYMLCDAGIAALVALDAMEAERDEARIMRDAYQKELRLVGIERDEALAAQLTRLTDPTKTNCCGAHVIGPEPYHCAACGEPI